MSVLLQVLRQEVHRPAETPGESSAPISLVTSTYEPQWVAGEAAMLGAGGAWQQAGWALRSRGAV
jgi:hypothetical protein